MTQLLNVRSFPLIARRRVLPEDVVYIGRAVPRVGLKASPWANPYRVTDRQFAPYPEWLRLAYVLGEYHRWIDALIANGHVDPEELRGKTLACWCPPAPCHGGVLLAWLEAHPVVPASGERIQFGLHRQPEADAETAPAWPSRAAFARRFDDAYRRRLRRSPT